MADLETAADAAVVRVKEVEQHGQRAHGSFAALRDEAADIRTQLEADWLALTEAARSLLQSAEEQRESFDRTARRRRPLRASGRHHPRAPEASRT